MARKHILIALSGMVALAVLLWGLTHFWQGLGSDLTGHGWFAYILGGVFTLLLSVGLFLLTFISARHGYDDLDTRDENET